ncbi:transmembrane protein 97 [Salpingoeca rosetta]|uniref:Transmembrane protein 97 n=1 Tax=Salpingoeca rosetta (strain ATCC 50818 / BSB-021) TaxID=946362 RepID=F2ULK2_SALR5|nr:transmembrane protein 97 [Salpingoeca rosetta]EGD78001.1 transmembrane protein 97 [Salpingoeca rosetta]|eukprot:XP_004990063.1 transmembrane protein 97 [Salpingoeca rosetta]
MATPRQQERWERAPFSLLDYVHYAYFGLHIPISLLMDFQAIVPLKYFPSFAQRLGTYYNNEYKDPLMAADPKPTWFKSFIWCEAGLQLPFFGLALYAMHTGGSWIRIPGIIYGTHVATTVVAVLAEVLCGEYGLSWKDKAWLASVYLPWLVIPLTYVWKLAFDPHPYRKLKQD